MADNKITMKIRRIREVWASLTRCGQMTTIFDKDGKLAREVKIKFSYAVSKNLNLIRGEIEPLEGIDKKLNEYNNEIMMIQKDHPERYSAVQAKYAPMISERETLDKEEHEISFHKIQASNSPEGILGIDLANLDFLIEGEL